MPAYINIPSHERAEAARNQLTTRAAARKIRPVSPPKNHRFLDALTPSRIEHTRQAGRQKEFGSHAPCHPHSLSPAFLSKEEKKKQAPGFRSQRTHPCRISPSRQGGNEPNQEARQEAAHGPVPVRAQIKKPSAAAGRKEAGERT